MEEAISFWKLWYRKSRTTANQNCIGVMATLGGRGWTPIPHSNWPQNSKYYKSNQPRDWTHIKPEQPFLYLIQIYSAPCSIWRISRRKMCLFFLAFYAWISGFRSFVWLLRCSWVVILRNAANLGYSFSLSLFLVYTLALELERLLAKPETHVAMYTNSAQIQNSTTLFSFGILHFLHFLHLKKKITYSEC